MKKIYYLFALATFAFTSVKAQIYVTEAGGAVTKDGSSWSTAYDKTQLQQAITSASSGQQVWVAKGTYRPTVNPIYNSADNRDKTFLMKRGVSVFGGFAGDEESLSDRDLQNTNNKTVLSGDLLGNDIEDNLDPNLKTDNTYHVVLISDGTSALLSYTLDGFTITGGFADGVGEVGLTSASTILFARNKGGGITARGLGAYNVLYNNLVIEGNIAETNAINEPGLGGGAYLHISSANTGKMNNVKFKKNNAGNGGALYTYFNSSSATFEVNDCAFNENSGDGGSGGGAIAKASSSGTLNIINTIFLKNTHTKYGGAIRSGVGETNIINCDFQENSSERGAVYTTGSSSLNIDNSIFNKNSTTGSGGHIYMYSGNLSVRKTTFSNGIATTNGGAIFVTSSGEGAVASTVRVSNSLFFNNIAAGGGAVYATNGSFEGVSNATAVGIVNNTFFSNKSTSENGGAIHFNNGVNVTLNLINNIFNNNLRNYDAINQSGGETYDFRRGATTANQNYYNNLVQIGTDLTNSGSRSVGENVENANPTSLFASTDPSQPNFLYPANDSFALDKGSNSLYTSSLGDVNIATDFLGNLRLVNTTVDLGAIEWNSTLPVKVKTFNAKANKNIVNLSWSVGLEDNVNHYIVERSTNGADFKEVAKVLAIGNNRYTSNDLQPVNGVAYYRLTSVDNDGTKAIYKDLKSVNFSLAPNTVLSVYPNPIQANNFDLSLSGYPADKYSYKITNAAGSIISKGTFNYDGVSLSKISLNAKGGLYILSLTNGDINASTKLIKL